MAKNPIDDDEDDDLSDFDFSDDGEEEFDPFEDEDFFDEDDESIEEEEFFSESEKIDTEKDKPSKVEENEAPVKIESEKNLSEKKVEPTVPTSVTKSEPISPEELPIILTMEIGRIELPVSQLLQLEPGNLLELNPLPSNGVDLTINGKIVGKGELIRIGDILGIRVVQLG
ncbi:MAG: FliM/FliN family flagellar motor switch protein [Parachlamydiaceae bacterium]|nr:FliM/FliN family flagellar motor switch protein [Parachlamydiaceae bacterium]